VVVRGIYVWGAEIPGVSESMAPGELKGVSPLWASDLEALEPWREARPTDAFPGTRWWRSFSARTDELILVTGPCSSSMDLAWVLARERLLPGWGSLLAVSQWSGRGRQGRVWYSPPGNVYAAVRLPEPEPTHIGLLHVTTAYLVVEALANLGIEAQIKWPNDLLVDGRKTGGILIEHRDEVVIAGIGINLATSPEVSRLRSEQALPAGHLAEFGCDMAPLNLWRNLLEDARGVYDEMTRLHASQDLPSRLDRHMAYLGRDVLVEPPGEPAYIGKVLGADAGGGLRVRVGGEETVVTSAGIYPLST